MILSGAWNFRMNWNKLHNFSLEKRNNLPASGKSASWSTNWKTSRPLGMLFEMQNWNSFAVGKGSSKQKGGGPMKSHIRSVVTSGNCLTLWSCLFGIQLFLSGTGSFGLARNLHKLQQRQQLQPCVDDVHVVLGQKSWPEEQQGPGPAASPTLIYLSAKCLGLNRSNSLCLPFLFFFFFFWQPAQLSSLSPKRLSLTQGLFCATTSSCSSWILFLRGKWAKFSGNLLVNCGPFSALACVIAEYFQLHSEQSSYSSE